MGFFSIGVLNPTNIIQCQVYIRLCGDSVAIKSIVLFELLFGRYIYKCTFLGHSLLRPWLLCNCNKKAFCMSVTRYIFSSKIMCIGEGQYVLCRQITLRWPVVCNNESQCDNVLPSGVRVSSIFDAEKPMCEPLNWIGAKPLLEQILHILRQLDPLEQPSDKFRSKYWHFSWKKTAFIGNILTVGMVFSVSKHCKIGILAQSSPM